MKKILFTALLLTAFTAEASSHTTYEKENNNSKDTVIIVKKPNEVKITDGKGYLQIEISGKEENENYSYSLKRGYSGENTSVIKENWEFNIPFVNNNKEENIDTATSSINTYHKRAKFSFNILDDLQFGMGLVTATSQANGMNVKMGNAGFEFILNNLASWKYKPAKGTSLTLGFGLDWRNYRMKGENRFVKEDNKIKINKYPEGADINFSRLKIFSMTLELMLRQKLFDNVYIGAGGVANFNTHGSLKTRYSVGKGKEKEGFKETSSSIHQEVVTFDLKGEISIKPLIFYVKYSPTNVMDTNYAPEFKSLSTGIIIAL